MKKLILSLSVSAVLFSCGGDSTKAEPNNDKDNTATKKELVEVEEVVTPVWSKVFVVDEFGDKTDKAAWAASFKGKYSNQHIDGDAIFTIRTMEGEDSWKKILLSIQKAGGLKVDLAGVYEEPKFKVKDEEGVVHEIKFLALRGMGLYEDSGEFWELLKSNAGKELKFSFSGKESYKFKAEGLDINQK